MAQFGWVLMLPRPDKKELEKIIDYRQRINFLKNHFQEFFQRVEPLLVNGLRFASRQGIIGSAYIVGPDNECQKLKKLLEEKGLGKMIPDTDCIRPA